MPAPTEATDHPESPANPAGARRRPPLWTLLRKSAAMSQAKAGRFIAMTRGGGRGSILPRKLRDPPRRVATRYRGWTLEGFRPDTSGQQIRFPSDGQHHSLSALGVGGSDQEDGLQNAARWWSRRGGRQDVLTAIKLGRSRRSTGGGGQRPPELGPHRAQLGRNRSRCGRVRPSLAQIGQTVSALGAPSAGFGQHTWSTSARDSATTFQVWSASVNNTPLSVPNWQRSAGPWSASVGSWSNSAQSASVGPNLAEAGQVWSNVAQD